MELTEDDFVLVTSIRNLAGHYSKKKEHFDGYYSKEK